jgi:hypothetical protein
MATLMLEGGADLRSIQEMLGHASLESTEIYTKISVRRLQAVYEATHPAAKIPAFVAEAQQTARPSSRMGSGCERNRGRAAAGQRGISRLVRRGHGALRLPPTPRCTGGPAGPSHGPAARS